MVTGIVGIDHVAVVTSDLSKAQRFYRKLGLRTTRSQRVTEQFPEEPNPHVYRAFAVLFSDQGPVLWIMEAESRSGPLKKFLTNRGPGLHHIGLRVKQTKSEEERIRKAGIRFIRRSMRDGREIRAIIDPHYSGRILFELVQRFPRH